MLITHKQLQPMQCYHIFYNSMDGCISCHKSLWQLFPSDGTDQAPWLMAYVLLCCAMDTIRANFLSNANATCKKTNVDNFQILKNGVKKLSSKNVVPKATNWLSLANCGSA